MTATNIEGNPVDVIQTSGSGGGGGGGAITAPLGPTTAPSAAVAIADTGTPISAATMPAGGVGLTGWLSAIFHNGGGGGGGGAITSPLGPSTTPANAVAITDTGTPPSGVTIPTGGVGLIGWLGAIYSKLTGSIAVTGTFFQATQPVSASALPLPTGAATSANQTTEIGSLSTIATAQGAGGTGIVEPTGGSGLLGWLSGIFNKLNTSIAVTGTFWPYALGQNVKANSIPVTQASDPDLRPGAQALTTPDVASTSNTGNNNVTYYTGAPTSGSSFSQAINGIETVTVAVTSITGTLNFEISGDGAEWYGATARQRGTSYTAASTTGVGLFEVDVAGKQQFRCRLSAGSAAAFVPSFSPNGGNVQIMNPVKIYDNTSNAQASIKPASTAPLSTDTALVVAVSPNSSLPAPVGAANIATNQVSVGTGATLIVAARTGAPGTGRASVVITSLGGSDIMLGNAGVTSGSGTLLSGVRGSSATFDDTAAIYGIVITGGSATSVSFAETY